MELLLGAILGALATEILSSLKKIFIKRRKWSRLRNLMQNDLFTLDSGYLPLEHGIPYLREEDIILKEIEKLFIVEIPDEYKYELECFGFVIRKESLLDGHTALSFLKNLEIDNPEELLKEAIEETVRLFLSDLNKGLTRFNGYLFGIDKILSTRFGEQERVRIEIRFYKTDYFTYRVFAYIFQKLREDEKLFKISKISDLNLYRPFLSSFGLGCFVIIDRGNGDEVLIGHRSNSVVVDKGKLHFSMNEAFSMNDRDGYGNPSFSWCMFRGLEEELGVSPLFKKYISQYEFLDLGMDIDRFEMGITSFVRIELDATFTYQNLLELYSIAKDKELETGIIESIKMKDIDHYIKENYNNFSAGCRATLKALSARYKAGYFPMEEKNTL